MTYGQDAVGMSFNPSGASDVDEVKRLFAEIIDMMHDIREDEGTDPEKRRLAAIAITETQTSQMWAVKAITWKV